LLFITAIHAQPAIAQTATRLNCNGCITTTQIRDGAIRAPDLASNALFGRTVHVRSNGPRPGANCRTLRKALAQIDDASVSNPVLVKLERGDYNCGSTPLAMKPFVTIEGAGRSFSRIIGNVAGLDLGVVTGANETALRHLTVEHVANGSGIAVTINTGGRRMNLTHVAIKLSSASVNQGYGIVADGGVLDLTSVSVQTNASAGQSQGILGTSGVKLNMMNVWIHNQSGNVGNPAALELRDTSSVTGHGVLFSSNVFAMLGRDNSVFELVGGTVIGGRGAAGSPSFTCVGIAKAGFTARAADCS
jgi:hypothetical protein